MIIMTSYMQLVVNITTSLRFSITVSTVVTTVTQTPLTYAVYKWPYSLAWGS